MSRMQSLARRNKRKLPKVGAKPQPPPGRPQAAPRDVLIDVQGRRRDPGVDKGGLLIAADKDRKRRESTRRALIHSRARLSALPDLHALLRRQIHRLPRLHIKRRVPGVHVSHHAVGPELRRRVGACQHLVAQPLFAVKRPPNLSP